MKIYKTMDNGVQIVEYDDSMAESLADMWNKSGDEWGGDSSVSTAEQIIADFAGGSYFNVFVALHNGEAVGLCSFNRYYKDADTAYVQVLNVRPDYQGKKVGKELVLACVNRTIELGYPRLDIHTWAGNTKAVPLYKKCGFMWEDRADTTHLSNFVPTVLKTELFADFFKTADWYNDNSREISIKTDGVKINKFELYGYSWANKDGRNLAVGFEKTGRRIRFIETDDYKIEFMADNHELAFGLNYKCAFKVENKSGKELNIKIAGKDDKVDGANIKFDCNFEEDVTGMREFNAEFCVEPISETIDTGRMHPCVLADVYINGLHAEFGLGIEPKFPLGVNIFEKRQQIVKIGMVCDIFISVKSALDKKASVNFAIPDNSMIRFPENKFTLDIEPDKTAMIHVRAEILNCGYEKLDIEYNITMDGANNIKFTRPMHVINQGIDTAFSYEMDNEYTAVNGLWKLSLYKNSNESSFYRTAGSGYARFQIPKLGKPYNDEFNLIKAADVRMYKSGAMMVLEADFESTFFRGAVLTVLNEFSASGVINRWYKVTNKSDKTLPRLYLQEQFYSSVGRRAAFHYDGEIHEVTDNNAYAFSDLYSEKLDENWVFDNSPNKSGMYWDKSYKPVFKWGDELLFEHELGELAPGAVFETKPSVYMNDIFNNIREFRNFVLGIDDTPMTAPHTVGHLDIKINGRNPFISASTGSIEAVIKNNRLKIYEGDIRLSSDIFDTNIQTNPEEDIVPANIFRLDITNKTPGIYLAELDFKFAAWEKTHKRALFMSDNAAKVTATVSDDVYTVNNGKLCFKVSPSYGGGVYSLKYGESDEGNEWLFSQYPKIAPYAWSNPFLGGIDLDIWNMNANLNLREKTSSEFVTVKDNFGTEWTGIKSTVTVNEFAEHKGLSYERFYVTQPGLPVLCCFVRFINNTGGYKQIGYDMQACISGTENLKDIYAHTKTHEREEYRIRMGDSWAETDRFVRLSYEGKSARAEKLYVYNDTERNSGGMSVSSDVHHCNVYTSAYIRVINGESETLRPVFFILTEKELTLDCVADLNRIIF